MSSSITYHSFRRIKLIRYLVAWKVNSSLVVQPECFAPELSYVLGSIISSRLSTQEGARWQKTMAPLQKHFDALSTKGGNPVPWTGFPGGSWPVDAVFFVYPGKRTYGHGELIFWEMKLFGDGADHGFFLETILPAMEEAGYTSDERWSRPNRVWGRFDIHAVYAARGRHWEPIVSDGLLNLRSHPDSSQWAEQLAFGSDAESALRQLMWVTPFEFEQAAGQGKEPAPGDGQDNTPDGSSSAMKTILDGLEHRWSLLVRSRRKGASGTRDGIDEEGKLILQKATEQAVRTPLLFKDLKPAPKECPGLWTGRHVFAPIPNEIIPCLELASILHIGRHIHFGCGTFALA